MLKNRFIELAARWYVFIFLIQYGVAKIFGGQFYTQERIPSDVAEKTLANATHFELAWTFMGASFIIVVYRYCRNCRGSMFVVGKNQINRRCNTSPRHDKRHRI